MKKFFLIFFSAVFSCFFCAQTLAQTYSNQGILNDITQSDNGDFIKKLEPGISNRLIAEAAFDDRYQTTNRRQEYKETRAKVRFYTDLHINKKVWISSYIKLDRIDNIDQTQRRNAAPNGGGDRSFENMGAFFEELNLHSTGEKYALIAGKFNLDFGTAWRWDRGLWIHEISEGYKQVEKLGFSGVYRIGDAKKNGLYSFSLSTFTNDRKNLDNSIMVRRDSVRKSDARPGDTRSLSSYSAALNIAFDFGEKFGASEKLTYHFSYINLAMNERATSVTPTKIDDQKGFSAGMNYIYPAAENLVLDGLLEYVKIKNFGGDSDVGEDYFAANLITRFYQNWNVLLGYGQRRNYEIDQSGFDQNLSEISLGYEFAKNYFFDKLTLQAGYKNQRTDFKTSLDTQNVYGFLLRYYKNF